MGGGGEECMFVCVKGGGVEVDQQMLPVATGGEGVGYRGGMGDWGKCFGLHMD